jgi:GAF domain-containing protein
LLREERIVGALVVRRKSTGEFRAEVVELINTFAIQSVLAIDNARTFVRERAVKHGINLDVRVDEKLGDFTGDERKIKQILLNLSRSARDQRLPSCYRSIDFGFSILRLNSVQVLDFGLREPEKDCRAQSMS